MKTGLAVRTTPRVKGFEGYGNTTTKKKGAFHTMSDELEEFPEPPRYKNEPGWVKANPLNNASYLRKACELYPEWSDEFRYADEQIEALVPGYNIDQIKEKFGGPRFYISFPEGVQADEDAKEKAWGIAFRVGTLLNKK